MFSVPGIVFLMIAAQPPNLLHNGGFEEIVNGAPAVWEKFVMPMEGAEAARDIGVSHDGVASARIHNPRPYEREPANNWSQNVVRDLAGKRLLVRGWIRTDDATHAAIWIQCCRKVPFTTLRFRSTYDVQPVYGDQDWTPVEVEVTAPEDTDFVTVRCVLQGEGTAWFDDISLLEVVEEPEPEDDLELTVPEDTTVEVEPETDDIIVETPEPEGNSEAESANEALQEANRELQAMLDSLRNTNDTLANQLSAQQDEIQALRNEIEMLRAAIEAANNPPVEPEVIPPLVPGRIEEEIPF